MDHMHKMTSYLAYVTVHAYYTGVQYSPRHAKQDWHGMFIHSVQSVQVPGTSSIHACLYEHIATMFRKE